MWSVKWWWLVRSHRRLAWSQQQQQQHRPEHQPCCLRLRWTNITFSLPWLLNIFLIFLFKYLIRLWLAMSVRQLLIFSRIFPRQNVLPHSLAQHALMSQVYISMQRCRSHDCRLPRFGFSWEVMHRNSPLNSYKLIPNGTFWTSVHHQIHTNTLILVSLDLLGNEGLSNFHMFS